MYYNMEKDIDHVLVGQEELKEICDRMAAKIIEDYGESGHDLVLVSILKGSVIFTAELYKRIPFPCAIEFMKVSSYGSGTDSSGFIQVHLDLKREIKDCDVVILEDIVDSGRTLKKLRSLLSDRGAHSVKCFTLLDKPSRRMVDFHPDFVGKEVPDEFVVGFGLDYDEKYRNLPYVGVLKPEIYEKN